MYFFFFLKIEYILVKSAKIQIINPNICSKILNYKIY